MGPTETLVFRAHAIGDVGVLSNNILRDVRMACRDQDSHSEVDCHFSRVNNTGTAFVRINTRASVNLLKIAELSCHQLPCLGSDRHECNVVFQFERSYRGGHISGYATNETPEMLPIGQVFETRLAARLSEAWREGSCPSLGPNGTIHIAFEYDKETMVPTRIHTIHISTQHNVVVTDELVASLLPVIRDVIPEQYLDENTFIHLQPSPYFLVGCGSTGYESITCARLIKGVFGGWGDFANQEPKENTARLAAKHIVAEGYARRCRVDVYYDIGAPEPLSVSVDTYGTGTISHEEILNIVKREFDFGPDILTMNLDHERGGGNGSFLKTMLPMDFFGGFHGVGNCEALRFGSIGISCH
ncbi:S-adenosylmethionine synthase 1 [Cornus florida]|uniref:S-adenosylmethionine synthase 1 n=1 Tax=Cornus florida TaxID=4283 RepID=UPI00289C0DDD|nr:S-adenosylmethionine synthase 1 [Cornus florida]